MPMTIELMHVMKLDDSPEWRVSKNLICEVGGETFVKLRAYDMGLVRMVCHGVLELPKRNYKLSLAQLDGYSSLYNLRQAKVSDLTGVAAQSSGRAELAGGCSAPVDAGTAKRRKSYVLTATQLQELREQAQVMDFEVPAVGALPAMIVQCIRPSHPKDELTVKLCPDTLYHLIMYIRELGITEDELQNRRQYRDPNCPEGFIKWGSAGYVAKQKPGEESQAKYVTMTKKRMQASPTESPSSVPLTDEERAASNSPSPVRKLRLYEDG
jgi:hypothetical protein